VLCVVGPKSRLPQRRLMEIRKPLAFRGRQSLVSFGLFPADRQDAAGRSRAADDAMAIPARPSDRKEGAHGYFCGHFYVTPLSVERRCLMKTAMRTLIVLTAVFFLLAVVSTDFAAGTYVLEVQPRAGGEGARITMDS